METSEMTKTARKSRAKKATEPQTDDYMVELKRLVGQRIATMREKQRAEAAAKPSVKWQDGRVIPSRLSADRRAKFALAAKDIGAEIDEIDRAMHAQMKSSRVYSDWLSKVRGVGVPTAAILMALVDTSGRLDANGRPIGEKPSQIRMFCGIATGADGKMMRLAAGERRRWNPHIRCALWNLGGAINKNRRFGGKYAKIYVDTVLTALREGKRKGAAMSKAWMKTADALVEDFYVVTRAAAGLPVWKNYLTARRGYAHGGVEAFAGPVMMTFDEAVALVSEGNDWRPTADYLSALETVGVSEEDAPEDEAGIAADADEALA